MKCTACENGTLVETKYEGVTVDRCQACQGVWLDNGELEIIINTKEKVFSKQLTKETISNAFMGIPASDRIDRACPKCQKKMQTINYGVDTGIIIDKCSEHGVWLDTHELEKIQARAEYWKENIKKKEEYFNSLVKDVEYSNKEKTEGVLLSMASFLNRLLE